jgi:glutamate-1-semialdehyde 2,1-aminomutase
VTPRYTDLLGEYSAGLYGHSEPVLVEAIKATLQENGSNLGANTKHEAALGLQCDAVDLVAVPACI